MSMRRFARLFSSMHCHYSALRFTKTHEWIQYDVNTKTAKIGITNYAQQQLGEIIHVELERVGKKFNQNDSISVLESVKIAADVYTPVSGTIKAINQAVEKEPWLINDKAMESWLVEIAFT